MEELSSVYIDDAIKNAYDALRYEDQHLFQEAINYYINAEDAISLAISFESNLSIKEILACFAKTLNSRIENLKCKVSMKLKGNKEQYQPIRYCSSPKRMKLNASHESNESIGDSVEHINTFNPDKFNDFNYRPIKYPKNEDVIGLEDAKKVLMEAIVLPRRFPELFKASFRKPWSKILLFGPPGTGKTKLCHMIASETKCTFFKVTSSDLLSSWFGETEKSIDNLFKSAEMSKPSIIFLDEIDSLMRKRTAQEDEVTRRIKNEFLVKMDSLNSSDDENSITNGMAVYVISSTNRPWDLDKAFFRRFEKRIYIPLPDLQTRVKLFKMNFSRNEYEERYHDFDEETYELFAQYTEGYSGADIELLIKDSGMKPIRELQKAEYFKIIENSSEKCWVPAMEGEEGSIKMSLFNIPEYDRVIPRKISMEDVLESIKAYNPTVNGIDIKKYEDFVNNLNINELN